MSVLGTLFLIAVLVPLAGVVMGVVAVVVDASVTSSLVAPPPVRLVLQVVCPLVTSVCRVLESLGLRTRLTAPRRLLIMVLTLVMTEGTQMLLDPKQLLCGLNMVPTLLIRKA